MEEFDEALASELEAHTALPIYRDDKRLQGGDFFNPALARSLCESVCMIMVFTPTYFDSDHPYCTREYLGMKHLEEVRLTGAATHGLIIPVILREQDGLPAEIFGVRQAHDFKHFSTAGGRKLIRDRRYMPTVERIARYIADRCRELRDHEPECEQFQLPDVDAARSLTRLISAPAPPFPGRNI